MACEPEISVGVVGARGYAGAELIRLIETHPRLRLCFAASRAHAGKAVESREGLRYIEPDPLEISAHGADVVVLALPDGATGSFVEAAGGAVVVDLSSDHRFDDGWVYGLSEHSAGGLAGARRISNPGCYATAVQLALRPLLGLIEGTPHAFGVSGYSGAGSAPSPRNDPELLAGGVTPYRLVGHTHEREVTRHLGRAVRFSPHVAPYFRGISVTVQCRLSAAASVESIIERYDSACEGCGLIRVLGERVPRVQEIVGENGAEIGGITLGSDGRDLAVVCTIDNLLKGAASQAVQNINLALGWPAELGLLEGVLA